MARKNKLTDEHRRFVVRELAAFETPQKVADAVKEEFGIEMSRNLVQHYDPRKNRKLSKKWRAHFELSRKAFRERMEDEISMANKFVRVRELQRIAALLGKRNNVVAQAQILEQIAKEVGNVHSNRRELSGPGGKPVQIQDVNEMTPEQVNDELRAHMKDPAVLAFVMGLATSNEASAIPPT
jgi:hypothetical protein